LNAQSPVEDKRPAGSPMDAAGGFSGLWRAHTGTAVRLVLTLVSLLMLARAYLLTGRYFIGSVWLDFWGWIGDFQLWVEHRYTFHDFVKPLFEHRIVTTRPLLLLDSLAFGMYGRTLIVANLVLLAILGLMLARLVRRGESGAGIWNWPPLFWIALISAVCQYENLLIPMDVGVALTCSTACAAILLLTEATSAAADRARAITFAVLAALMAVAAVFSMASGVLAIPALLLMLPLRRARPVVWAVFVPAVLLGVALFFHHYQGVHDLDSTLFDLRRVPVRLLYVGNFLGSAFVAFPQFAAPAGFVLFGLFLLAATALIRGYTLKGKALPGGDAALIALIAFVSLGGPVGSISFRIFLGGADAALASRYASYSLLLIVAVLGLYIRWARRDRVPGWINRYGFPAVGLVLLLLTNVPAYNFRGAYMHEAVTIGAQFIRNNVAVEGPLAPIMGRTADDFRDEITFLHARNLNMFSDAAGPPRAMLDSLNGVRDFGALPVCKGYVDHAYALDGTGFLISGWVVDPKGRTSAPWIAAVDAAGKLLGTASSLTRRSDVQRSLNMAKRAYGFSAGFRLAAPIDPGTEPTVQILGLFSDKRHPICRLPTPAVIGPVLIAPAAKMSDLTPAAAEQEVDGMEPWRMGAGGPAEAAPGAVPMWMTRQGQEKASLHFRLNPLPQAGRAVALPFSVTNDAPGNRIIFTLGDGTRLETELPAAPELPGWHAAIVPSEQLVKHGGPVTVEVQAQGGAGLVVGAPLLATLRPEWSKLF